MKHKKNDTYGAKDPPGSIQDAIKKIKNSLFPMIQEL
jgi:hypothetical protein